jgi:hypothetical protein
MVELGDGPREPADGDNPGRAEAGPGAGREAALARIAAEDQFPTRQEARTASWSGTGDNRPDGSRAQAAADDSQPDRQQPPDNPAEKTRPGHPDLRDRYPADYKLAPDAPPPRIDGPHESPERWADAVNPDKADEARSCNCGECARSVDSTWHGYPAAAAAVDFPRHQGDTAARMAEWAGTKPVPASMADIKKRLDKLGPGSPLSSVAAGRVAAVTGSTPSMRAVP